MLGTLAEKSGLYMSTVSGWSNTKKTWFYRKFGEIIVKHMLGDNITNLSVGHSLFKLTIFVDVM